MTALDAIAQRESTLAYRNAEKGLRRQAKWMLLCQDQEEAEKMLRLAEAVGIEMVRNHRGPGRDEWERVA